MNNLTTTILIFVIVVIGCFLSRYLLELSKQIKSQVHDQDEDNMLQRINDVIRQCVVATNQEFVESLKKDGEFTIEAQRDAFYNTKEAIMDLLSADAIKYIKTVYNDLNLFLDKKIEEEVNKNK